MIKSKSGAIAPRVIKKNNLGFDLNSSFKDLGEKVYSRSVDIPKCVVDHVTIYMTIWYTESF